jgi:tetratricopeptide (TPR) repeat protein
MVKTVSALQRFNAHRFTEAVEAYRRQLRQSPDDWGNIEGLGHALMAAGEFAEAIPYLERVGDYASSLHPGAMGRQIELSVCNWIIGEHTTALNIIKGLVTAVRDGKINYTDIAGGVTQGLILCYMAASLRATSDVDLAMKYLQKLATSRRIQYWPGPAAQFLLGGLTFGDATKNATGSADLADAKKIAEQDLMKRRHLAALLFAAGTERRMADDETGCRMFMSECASLTHPLVEYEWYLAKGEVSSL